MLGWLDNWVLRKPFEGRAALDYHRLARPSFGDLDGRVLAALAPDLVGARALLDVGAGAGELARRATGGGFSVIALEPSRTFTRLTTPGVITARGVAEALPIFRRVVRPGGAAWIVELDRGANHERVARHLAGNPSSVARTLFRMFVLPVCPAPAHFQALARAAGWHPGDVAADPEQPFFLLRLS